MNFNVFLKNIISSLFPLSFRPSKYAHCFFLLCFISDLSCLDNSDTDGENFIFSSADFQTLGDRRNRILSFANDVSSVDFRSDSVSFDPVDVVDARIEGPTDALTDALYELSTSSVLTQY